MVYTDGQYLGVTVIARALSWAAALADAKVELSPGGEAFDAPARFERRMAAKFIRHGVLDRAIDTGQALRLFSGAEPPR